MKEELRQEIKIKNQENSYHDVGIRSWSQPQLTSPRGDLIVATCYNSTMGYQLYYGISTSQQVSTSMLGINIIVDYQSQCQISICAFGYWCIWVSAIDKRQATADVHWTTTGGDWQRWGTSRATLTHQGFLFLQNL